MAFRIELEIFRIYITSDQDLLLMKRGILKLYENGAGGDNI